MQSDQKTFSRREWLLAIVILLLVEYFLISNSYQHSSEQEVLNYISFAGTMSSILLAVIAIIYGFYQNYSQQQASGQMLAQIENLRSLSERLGQSPLRLEAQLDRLNGIVVAVDEKLLTSHKKIDSLEDKLTAFQHGLTSSVKPNQSEDVGQLDSKRKLAKAVLSQTTFEADVFAYSLAHYHNLKKSPSFRPNDLFGKYFVIPAYTAKKDQDTTALICTAVQLTATLRSLGLLRYEDDKYTMTDELIETLPEIIQTAKESTQDWVRKAIADIDAIAE